MEGAQDLTGQAWLLCLTLNQSAVLGTVHNILKYLIDSDILCHVVVIVLQKMQSRHVISPSDFFPYWTPQRH